MKGDKVTVYGYLDDDLFQDTSMEATSMFIEGLNSYFYASGGDDAPATGGFPLGASVRARSQPCNAEEEPWATPA